MEELIQRRKMINPNAHAEEVFDLFSVPAYGTYSPVKSIGSEIGSAKQLVEHGDVLLCKIVPHIRRAWVVPQPGPRRQIASGEWIVLRHEAIDPGFLRHLVIGNDFHTKFMQTVAGVGGSLLRARPAQVGRIEVPIPPLPEQRRIAAILDEADALRTKRRVALELLDEVEDRIVERYARDASLVVFDELVLGFKYGTSVKSGPVGQTVLRIPNIGARGLVLDDLKYVDLARGEQERLALGSGDVLFVRSNGNPEMIGRCAAFDSRIADRDQPVVYASYLIRARLKPGLDAPALAAMMRTPIVRRQMHAAAATSAGQYNINIKSLGALQVPGLSAGAAAALSADLNELQQERERHQAGLVSLDTFFASLQHRAFTGRL